MSTAPDSQFQPVRQPADVPEPWRSFPFLAADLPRYTGAIGWGGASAFALTTVAGDGTSRALVGVGGPAELAAVIAAAFDEAGVPLPGSGLESTPLAVASLTRGAWDRLPAPVRARLGLDRAAHWDWLVTTTDPPVQPGEDRVVELDLTTDRAELEGLQRLVLPQTYTTLDRPDTRWYGWRDDEGVLRCMAAATTRKGELHLGSIGTHPDWRRRGLAATITAALTRIGLRRAGQVSLGLYTDNSAAQRVYRRLGYRLGQEVESRRPTR